MVSNRANLFNRQSLRVLEVERAYTLCPKPLVTEGKTKNSYSRERTHSRTKRKGKIGGGFGDSFMRSLVILRVAWSHLPNERKRKRHGLPHSTTYGRSGSGFTSTVVFSAIQRTSTGSAVGRSAVLCRYCYWSGAILDPSPIVNFGVAVSTEKTQNRKAPQLKNWREVDDLRGDPEKCKLPCRLAKAEGR